LIIKRLRLIKVQADFGRFFLVNRLLEIVIVKNQVVYKKNLFEKEWIYKQEPRLQVHFQQEGFVARGG
jgi:hypothetical protein